RRWRRLHALAVPLRRRADVAASVEHEPHPTRSEARAAIAPLYATGRTLCVESVEHFKTQQRSMLELYSIQPTDATVSPRRLGAPRGSVEGGLQARIGPVQSRRRTKPEGTDARRTILIGCTRASARPISWKP